MMFILKLYFVKNDVAVITFKWKLELFMAGASINTQHDKKKQRPQCVCLCKRRASATFGSSF